MVDTARQRQWLLRRPSRSGTRISIYCRPVWRLGHNGFTFLKSGDHLLMTDTAYSPSRDICTSFLANYGVSTDFYDPMIEPELKS